MHTGLQPCHNIVTTLSQVVTTLQIVVVTGLPCDCGVVVITESWYFCVGNTARSVFDKCYAMHKA